MAGVFRTSLRFVAASAVFFASACVTPRMHTQDELNAVTRQCGLALGELIQDEMEKRVLIALRNEVTPQQRVCVVRWARRNGLKPVFVSMSFPS